MSGNKLLDTNILIYLSKKSLKIEDIASPKDELFISVISYMEALAYDFQSKNEEQIIQNLCSTMTVLNINSTIVSEVILLKKKKKIKLPDAIIYATALCNNLSLLTGNTDDFKNISSKVKIINPFK